MRHGEIDTKIQKEVVNTGMIHGHCLGAIKLNRTVDIVSLKLDD